MRITAEISPVELGDALIHHKQELITVLEAISTAIETITAKFKESTVQIKINKPDPPEVHTVLLSNGEPAKPEKKPRTKEEQDAIDSIKKAYFEKRTRTKRKDIDNAAIVEMQDEKGMKFAAIAKELGCCEQTVINRYNKAKNGGKK
ncbi:MAG: hypothetical protein K5870_00860 [Lachnospiraceae bacterium]|nr:hypothetical protein [Lachnospiraceae bacterium]